MLVWRLAWGIQRAIRWHARWKEGDVNLHLRARPGDGQKRPRRTLAARPDLTALSEAEIRELQAINSAMRPTWDDPFGEAALTPQQVARVRDLAAKAWKTG
jgi:hypothetical protein